jgi:hypothetical protein
VPLSDRARAYLEANRSAAMITLRPSGAAHAVRVGVALVDGKVWSSGTKDRVRTRYLRRDPRATLFVFGSGYEALTLEATVRILDGEDAPEQNWQLFSVMQRTMTPPASPGHLKWFGAELSRTDFLKRMSDEGRLIYEFDVTREYGLRTQG